MRTTFSLYLAFISIILFGNVSAQRITIMPSASYIKGTGNNIANLFGGGIQITYRILENMHGGIKYSYYPAKTTRNEIGNGFSASFEDQASNITSTYSYFLKPSANSWRPYIGLDAGYNFSKQQITFNDIFTGVKRSSQSAHNVLISPKVGTQFNFSKHIGLFVQAQYHFSVQKTKEQFVGYTGLGEPIVISPIQKFFSVDAGLAVSF